MKIALATDHAGFERLQKIEEHLEATGHEFHNFGPPSFNPEDDYNEFVVAAAKAVLSGEYEVGIILGGTAEGEGMAVNRLLGVRCTVWYGPAVAIEAIDAEGNMSDDPYEILRLSRQHNHANVLSLAGRFVDDNIAKKAIDIWLSTPWSDEERHKRRVAKLDNPLV